MSKRIDLVGKKFGRWTVIKQSHISQKRIYWLCKCDCGNSNTIAGYTLRYGSSTSCGCYKSERVINRCRKNLVGQTFGYWSVIEFHHTNKHNKAVWKCKCKCGNIGLVETGTLISGNCKSCGCYSIEVRTNRRADLTKKKFGLLTPIRPFSSKPVTWECRCDCGKKCVVRADSLRSKKTKSCGCLKNIRIKERCLKNIAGFRFGKLTAIKYKYSKEKVYWECLCDCGQIHITRQNSLHNGNVSSCGNCVNKKNGQTTSRVNEKLVELIGRGEHNFRIGRKSVDIALLEEKIAIEYDSWYWHANKQQKDKNRRRWLNRRGWKVLRIKGNKMLPTKEIINKKLNILIYSNKKNITIKLDDWNKGNTFEDIKTWEPQHTKL